MQQVHRQTDVQRNGQTDKQVASAGHAGGVSCMTAHEGASQCLAVIACMMLRTLRTDAFLCFTAKPVVQPSVVAAQTCKRDGTMHHTHTCTILTLGLLGEPHVSGSLYYILLYTKP